MALSCSFYLIKISYHSECKLCTMFVRNTHTHTHTQRNTRTYNYTNTWICTSWICSRACLSVCLSVHLATVSYITVVYQIVYKIAIFTCSFLITYYKIEIWKQLKSRLSTYALSLLRQVRWTHRSVLGIYISALDSYIFCKRQAKPVRLQNWITTTAIIEIIIIIIIS